MEVQRNSSTSFTTSERVPIARLNPLLPEQPSSSIHAIVTLIWPYRSSNRTLTILLAEPDFRLRRSRGQVRVQFDGSSAQHVSESGIGSGDEVILSLVGVEWVKDDSTGQTPGRGIEWELRYSETLLLQVKQIDSSKISQISIDHPKPRDPPPSIERPPSQVPIQFPPRSASPLSQRPGLTRTDTAEWSSPTFIKRARDSYGALFDSGSDIFGEDGAVSGFGRKRTRFGRGSGNWRYSSRSPSPEAEIVEDKLASDPSPQAYVKPLTTDEGCQTLGPDDDDAAEALASLSQQISAGGEKYVWRDAIPAVETEADASVHRPLTNETSVVTAEMPPPPRPTLITNSPYQSQLDDLNTVGGYPRTSPDPPRLLPVPSEALPLVSPLESSGSDLLHGYFDTQPTTTASGSEWYKQRPMATEDIGTDFELPVPEDLYGLSPEAYAEVGTAQVEQEILFLEDIQERQLQSDLADQYGHWQQTAMAATEQLDCSKSPHTHSPSHADGGLEFQSPGLNQESGPYYGYDLSRPKSQNSTNVYPDPNDEFDEELSKSELKEIHYPELLDPSYQNIQRQSSHGNSPAHLSAAAAAMSRSQSALSEPIDLTEDSDEEGEGEEFNEGMETDDAEDATGPERRMKDPHYLLGIAEEDEAEYGEDEFEEEEYYDEAEPDLKPSGFPRRYDLNESGQDDDDDDEGEDGEDEEDEDDMEEEYDEDELSNDEGPFMPSKPVARGPPVVIDLLSSDDEDTDLPTAPKYALAPQSTDKDLSGQEVTDEEDGRDTDIDGIDGGDVAPNLHPPHGENNVLQEASSPEPASTKQEWHKLGRQQTIVEQSMHMNDIEHQDAGDESVVYSEPPGNTRLTNDIVTTPPATLHGFDGSFDSPNGEVRYPVLPSEEGSVDFASDAYQPQSDILLNHQLPTPEATQLSSAAIISANVSFSSTSEQEPISGNIGHATGTTATQESLEIAAAEVARGTIEISIIGMSPPSGSVVVQPPTTPIRSRLRSSTVEVRIGTAERSPLIFDNSPRIAQGYDASADLVMAELDSAEKQAREKLTPTKPASLTRGLITDFADFTPLKLIRFHQDKKLDNISVATTRSSEPRRALKGLRHYFTSFNVIDPSTPSGVTEIQIFRPYQEALPVVDVGDSILLRNFSVRSEKPGFALRSEDASSWLVFKKDGTTQSKGPPVEFGSKEVEFAERLQMWFDGLDAESLAKIKRANADKASVTTGNAKVH